MSVLAYEIDPNLIEPLEATLTEARVLATSFGRMLNTSVREANFILNPPVAGAGNILLMNPPLQEARRQQR